MTLKATSSLRMQSIAPPGVAVKECCCLLLNYLDIELYNVREDLQIHHISVKVFDIMGNINLNRSTFVEKSKIKKNPSKSQ